MGNAGFQLALWNILDWKFIKTSFERIALAFSYIKFISANGLLSQVWNFVSDQTLISTGHAISQSHINYTYVSSELKTVKSLNTWKF